MPKVFIFDTETTGLIPKQGAGFNNFHPYTNLSKYNQCRLVSICWKTFTEDGCPLQTKYFVVKPKDFVIDDESIATGINGITSEIASQGTDIEHIIENLEKDLEDVSLIVAHNINFDVRIVSSELHRYQYSDFCNKFISLPTYCTCMNGNDITKIKPRGWKIYKIPKLSELYQHLFSESFGNAHNAEADVNACAKCYFKMITLI